MFLVSPDDVFLSFCLNLKGMESGTHRSLKSAKLQNSTPRTGKRRTNGVERGGTGEKKRVVGIGMGVGHGGSDHKAGTKLSNSSIGGAPQKHHPQRGKVD